MDWLSSTCATLAGFNVDMELSNLVLRVDRDSLSGVSEAATSDCGVGLGRGSGSILQQRRGDAGFPFRWLRCGRRIDRAEILPDDEDDKDPPSRRRYCMIEVILHFNASMLFPGNDLPEDHIKIIVYLKAIPISGAPVGTAPIWQYLSPAALSSMLNTYKSRCAWLSCHSYVFLLSMVVRWFEATYEFTWIINN